MRLIRHLNELEGEEQVGLTSEEMMSMIKRDCKQYLRLLKGRKPLVRGMKIQTPIRPDELGKKSVRKDRIPRGTPIKTFNKFNKWLEDNGHVRRDKGFMVTSDIKTSSIFGPVYFVFPIGKFNYTWIKAKDFNIDNHETGWDVFYSINL